LTRNEKIFVVEQNRDAQLLNLLLGETNVDRDSCYSILHYNGMPIDSSGIVQGVLNQVREEAAA